MLIGLTLENKRWIWAVWDYWPGFDTLRDGDCVLMIVSGVDGVWFIDIHRYPPCRVPAIRCAGIAHRPGCDRSGRNDCDEIIGMVDALLSCWAACKCWTWSLKCTSLGNSNFSTVENWRQTWFANVVVDEFTAWSYHETCSYHWFATAMRSTIVEDRTVKNYSHKDGVHDIDSSTVTFNNYPTISIFSPKTFSCCMTTHQSCQRMALEGFQFTWQFSSHDTLAIMLEFTWKWMFRLAKSYALRLSTSWIEYRQLPQWWPYQQRSWTHSAKIEVS